jgi:hypothetical protein
MSDSTVQPQLPWCHYWWTTGLWISPEQLADSLVEKLLASNRHAAAEVLEVVLLGATS